MQLQQFVDRQRPVRSLPVSSDPDLCPACDVRPSLPSDPDRYCSQCRSFTDRSK